MPTVTWTGGANDETWATGANWSGGSAPVNGDDVIVDSTAQDIRIMPAAAPASGSFASFVRTPGHTGNIGGGGSALNLSATVVRLASTSGQIYLGTGTRTTTHIDNTGTGEVVLSAGTNTTVNCGRTGRVTIGGAATCTTLRSCGASVTAEDNATAFTSATVSGIFDTRRSVATLVADQGSTVILRNSAAVTTSATVNGGGYLNQRSAGTIASLEVKPGGRYDPRGSVKSATITALIKWAGSTVDVTAESVSITVSGTTFYGSQS